MRYDFTEALTASFFLIKSQRQIKDNILKLIKLNNMEILPTLKISTRKDIEHEWMKNRARVSNNIEIIFINGSRKFSDDLQKIKKVKNQ